MGVADRKPIGPDHPVRHNRAAECYLCGKKLGAYDTKLIERVEPYRTGASCTTDMGIGRHGDRIYSVASPGKPEGFEPKGLSCGFVKIKRRLNPGDRVDLRDRHRRIPVTIVDDVRPDRTARRPIAEMI